MLASIIGIGRSSILGTTGGVASSNVNLISAPAWDHRLLPRTTCEHVSQNLAIVRCGVPIAIARAVSPGLRRGHRPQTLCPLHSRHRLKSGAAFWPHDRRSLHVPPVAPGYRLHPCHAREHRGEEIALEEGGA